jgi:cytidylate kinase
MRRWAIELQSHAQDSVSPTDTKPDVLTLVHPYITISRECGVDATDIAQQVASECGYHVLDRELIDHLAEHDHLSRLALELVDERAVSWFHEMFGKWLEAQLVSQAEYVQKLLRIVLLAAQHGSSIFVGRGVQFMLPRERGLAVRIIGSLNQRLECVAKRNHCSESQAKKIVAETDDNRAQFVKRYFHHDIADPHLYDLVLNLDRIPRTEVVELISLEAKRHLERAQSQESGRNSADRQLRRLDNWPNRQR